MSVSLTVLRSRDFRLMLGARMLAMMALVAQDVIIGWQVYSITHDPFMLGLAGLVEALPALACGFFSGHVVDKSRPHRIYMLCLGALALNAFVLLLTGGGLISIAEGHTLIFLFGGVFFSGLARSFIMPASFAILPQLVPRAQFPAASAWFSSGFQMAVITGPAIAGLIYGGYGVTAAWLIPCSVFSGALVLVFAMSKKTKCYKSEQIRERAMQSIKAGWRFVWHNKTLLSVMVLDMFAVLFGGAVAMLPAYAHEVLHVGSEGLGALRAAPALGAIVTALYLALKPFKIVHASTMLTVVAGFGVCMIGFGLSTNFTLSMVFLAASGAFDSVSMVIRATLMQLLTPDAMRGRVAALNSMFIISSNEIGAFESGTAAKLMGLVPSIVFGGICTVAIAAGTALLSPQLRRTKIDANKVPL
jgi:MFS family permease